MVMLGLRSGIELAVGSDLGLRFKTAQTYKCKLYTEDPGSRYCIHDV